MILNPNLYKEALDKRKDTILQGIAEGGKYDTLTVFSLGSHIPIVALLAYCLRPDVGGLNPDLLRILELNNNEVYRYESITPWDDL